MPIEVADFDIQVTIVMKIAPRNGRCESHAYCFHQVVRRYLGDNGKRSVYDVVAQEGERGWEVGLPGVVGACEIPED